MNALNPQFDTYQLADRYSRTKGRVFLTGTQALVRVMLDQARRDKAAGLNTAGFVSGYRGSPLGGVDLEMWKSREALKDARIEFMPAVNEDLGATAVLGAQQAALDPECQYDGVFSMWYGKGPGVDRSGDALRHGNAYGSSPKGGVLVVAGDDHGCVSSSMPHQSDVAFMTWFMPTLNPASVEEYLSFGAYGIALSRFSGTWVGFKAVSETVESARSVDLMPDRQFVLPEIDVPPGGLHVRRADLPSPEIETRIEAKLAAVEAFVEANPIDKHIYDIADATFGIVTTGKGHLDTMEALRLLGLDEAACRRLGIDIYKIGMVWPLARRDALDFMRGKQEVLVIEEKRGIIESQFKEYFYDWPGHKPEKMVGKHRAAGDALVPWTGELSPFQLVPVIAERLHRFFPSENLIERARHITQTPAPVLQLPGATRTPYFCSGCPHNSSTKIPEGSQAASGIGCHVMASWMNRNTVGYAQMGGEGVPWVAASKFTGNRHMFQNLGEGTWYHSGSLAIRQAVAAGTNITYKILFNDAVAMTGGQPVDGPVSVVSIAQTCRAEGVDRIVVVSDDITKYTPGDFPAGTAFHDRADLDPVQRSLRQVPGVSVLIYEQTCATEKRRRRKRGTMDDPPRFAWINSEVCEGCGDCSVESNCLSVEPRATELGRKRKINLSSCNKDFSCLNGFCPSFVTIEGGKRRKEPAVIDLAQTLAGIPAPALKGADRVFDLMVAGVGGTGVVTIGALITMAAHLEGRGASVLDFTGFAQKFGTVIGYVRLAPQPQDIHQVRIEAGSADAVIACDAVVASSPKASAHYRAGTDVVLNRAEMPTGDLVLNRDASLQIDAREAMVASVVGADRLTAFDANRASEALMGDAVFANVIMLGAAWQNGLVPVSEGALKRAMALNGVAVDANIRAFEIGRVMAHDPDLLAGLMDNAPTMPIGPDQTVAKLTRRLTDYHDAAYGDRFAQRIENLARAFDADNRDSLVILAAKSLHKMMAIKDEYEVARHLTSPEFAAEIAQNFGGDYRVSYHLAPPILTRSKDARGRPVKRAFGPWLAPFLRGLARVRHVRGRWFDPFSYTADRRHDYAALAWFEDVLATVENRAGQMTPDTLTEIFSAPMDIRGYGPVREAALQSVQRRVRALLG
jgi:indolepyruvate ferredoxin oxidoreductase